MNNPPNPAVTVTQADRPIAEHPCHGLFSTAGDRLTHRHWFQYDALMPTCERCGTPIDREHKETGPVSWAPEKRREIVTLSDRHALSNAAMNALGEWLAWPDAGRDGPREVTVAQTLSFLAGLPNRLGYDTRQSIPAAGVGEGLREALEPFAREADAQERVTSFSSGESVILRTKITIGQLRRARVAFAALSTPDALLLGGDAMRGEG